MMRIISPPERVDAYLVRMIKAAQSFDIEEMDQASLPIRLKTVENLRIAISDYHIDYLLDPLDDLVDQVRKAIPKAVPSTSFSG